MKRLLKKAGLAFILLQVLVLNQAYAGSNEEDVLFGAYIFLMTIPVIAALLSLLLNLKNLSRAIVLVFIIWFVYMALITNFFTSFEDIFTDKYYDNSWLYWLPITAILIITFILFIKEKPKEENKN